VPVVEIIPTLLIGFGIPYLLWRRWKADGEEMRRHVDEGGVLGTRRK
jgi:hypothetical protein